MDGYNNHCDDEKRRITDLGAEVGSEGWGWGGVGSKLADHTVRLVGYSSHLEDKKQRITDLDAEVGSEGLGVGVGYDLNWLTSLYSNHWEDKKRIIADLDAEVGSEGWVWGGVGNKLAIAFTLRTRNRE